MTKIWFIFSKDLHISPSEIDEMFWYDIIFLLKEYENYVNENKEEQERQEAEYQDQMPKIDQPQIPQIPKLNMPSFDSITKGFNF